MSDKVKGSLLTILFAGIGCTLFIIIDNWITTNAIAKSVNSMVQYINMKNNDCEEDTQAIGFACEPVEQEDD